jgi:ATP-dependent Lon protease
MPFKPFPSKKRVPVPPSDDSSVDEHGNIRHLIDYDYEESSSESDLPPRKAKRAAAKKIHKAIADTATTTSNDSEKPTIIITELKRKKTKKYEPETEESEESEAPTPKKYKNKSTNKKRHYDADEETEETEESEAPTPKKSKKTKIVKKRRYETEDEESEAPTPKKKRYEPEEDEEDEEEYEEEDEDEEDEEEVEYAGKRISLFDLLNGDEDPRKPKKYNLKKESATVRRFVELVNQEAEEEDNIDNDITYFKSLSTDKQMALMKVLEAKAAPVEIQTPLKFKILERVANHPDLARIAMSKYNALMNIDPSSTEYYKCSHWIQGFTNLPLGIYKDLPVKLEDGAEKCQNFMESLNKCLDSAIYGHDEAKLQIMQFVSSWIANPKAHGNVLSIHGPPGIGKTSLVKDGIAKALGRPFHFITLGGATDASFLDGHSYTYEGSTWGRIADVLMQSKCMNPIIYFDELDKVSQTPKGDEIMNLLIHLTDGSQNDRFQDKYFTGINLDLSRCLFIFSHNNHEMVNPILKDRMYNVEVKGFNTKEKLIIAEKYLLNAALQEVGLYEKVSFQKDIIKFIIEHYTGGEQGVRELKRCLQTVVSKINLLRFFNSPKQVPFAIEGFSLPFTIKQSHIELFLKRKDTIDPSIAHLYC